MVLTNWLNDLFQRRLSRRRAAARRKAYRPYRQHAPQLVGQSELLEDRTLLAFDLTLSTSPTVGVTVQTDGDTTTFTASASGANVKVFDIGDELKAGRNVVVSTGSSGAEAGDITTVVGGVGFSNVAGTTLTFQSGTGANLVGDISLPGIFFSNPGSLQVLAHGNLLVQGTTVVDTISLSSATGSISTNSTGQLEGLNLTATAATGIDVATRVDNLEAQTNSGGISVKEFDGLTIDGLTISGVTNSGDIEITAGTTVTIAEAVSNNGGDVDITGNALNLNASVTANGTFDAQTPTANLNADISASTITGTATTVNVTAPGQIQDGIDIAASGATVNVAAGTYDGNLSIQKSVDLIGAGADVTTITTSAAVDYLILVGNTSKPTFSQGMTIEGFTLVSPTLIGDHDLIGLRASGASMVDPIMIRNNIFDGQNLNKGIETAGGYGTANVVVEGNEFVENTYAMFLNAAIDWRIEDNTFTDSYTGGLELNTGALNQLHDVLIEGNVFTNTSTRPNFAGSPYLAALNIASTARDIQVRDNQLLASQNYALVIHDRGSVDLSGIEIENNLIQGTDLTGVYVFDDGGLGSWSGTFASFAGNDFVDNLIQVDDQSGAVDLQALLDDNTFDRAVTVRDSGIKVPTIFSSIQDGVDAAVAGDTVQVEAGTYAEDVTVNKSLTIAGANAGIAAGVDGGMRGAESVLIGGFRVGADTVTIDGLTIQDGIGPAGIGDITAVFLVGGSESVTIQNNIIDGPGIGGPPFSRGIISTFNGNNNNVQILNNELLNWTTAVYNQGNNGVLVSGNFIHANNSGIANDFVQNVVVSNNAITGNNGAFGFFGNPADGIVDATLFNNDLSGNAVRTISHFGGDAINASGNWFGTTNVATIIAGFRSNGIDGTASAIDFSPFLNSGDQSVANQSVAGFQADLSSVTVHSLGQQTDSVGRVQEGINLVNTGGTVNVLAGTFVHTGQLNINKTVNVSGVGQDETIIQRAGHVSGKEQRTIELQAPGITLQSLTLGGWVDPPPNSEVGFGYLAWLGAGADDATFDDVRFDANDNRVAIYVGTHDGLTVTDSRFTGTYFRAAIRGAGENMFISRNSFEESHYWYSPIYFEYGGETSGEISFNYFANRVGVNNQVYGNFKSDGTGLYAITNFQPHTTTADGLQIVHNTFHFQDSDLVNQEGNRPIPQGVYIDPLVPASGPIEIRDNIFQGYQYTGEQPSNGPDEVKWSPAGGVFGGALELDGDNDYGIFQDPDFDYNLGNAGTFSIWVNLKEGGRDQQLARGPFVAQIDSANRAYFYTNRGQSSSTLVRTTNNAVPIGEWVHLTFTWDFATKTGRIYINGVEASYLNGPSVASWTTPFQLANQQQYLGRDPGDDGRFLNGFVDDWAWYNRALTPAEIATISNPNGNGVADGPDENNNLVAHWDFDQSSGDVAIDNINGTELNLIVDVVVPPGPEFRPGMGQFNGALEFDGADDFATFQDPSFNVGERGTINFWVNMDNTGRRNQFLEGPGNGGFEVQFRTNSSGQVYSRVTTDGDFVIRSGGDAATLNGNWTNIQIIYDFNGLPIADGGGNLRIYLNGVESGYLGGFTPTDLSWPGIVSTVDQLMNIGRDPGDPSRFFDGLMDDFAWFDDVLNSTERAEIRGTSIGTSSLNGDSRLIAYWNFDDAPGTEIVPGDGGTTIDLYLQTEPPPPPIQGFAINATAGTVVTNNVFYLNDVDYNNAVNDLGDNLFGNPVFKLSGTTTEEIYQIGFGSIAAFASSEYELNTNTTTPHVGAYQGDPGPFGTGDLIINGSDGDDLLTLNMTGPDSGTLSFIRDFGGSNEEIFDPVVLTDITGIEFNGLEGDDRLVINNLAGPVFAPVNGIIFNAGDGGENTPGGNPDGDALELVGGTVTTLEFDYTNENDGFVSYDGTQVIAYTGLEPINSTIEADHVILDYSNSLTDAITVVDNNDGTLTVDSGNSEVTTFDKPSDSLTIMAETGDSVTFQGATAITLGAADLDVDAGSIMVNQNVNTSGDAELNATGSTISGTATLTANDLTADALSGIQLNTTVDTIDASVSGAGAIDIDETDGVELTDVTTANGSITVAAGGDTEAINVVSQTDNDANDISITVSAGDLFVTNIDAKTSDGDVNLSVPNGSIGGPTAPAFVGIIDDGDAGYMDTGFTVGANPAFMGDVRFSAANAGNTATWSFTGLTPGIYTVAATWTAQSNRATSAPFTVTDANGTSMFSINQELAPLNDFNESGTPFQQLGGTFVVDGSGTLTVSLTDVGANEFVIADAIRIELVSSAASGQVTGDVLDASAATGIDLETTVNEVNATTSGMGDITLDESDAVTLSNVVSADGSINITAGSGITATNLISSTDAGANDIFLNAATGNLIVGTVNAGPSAGDVNLTATMGSILDDANNATLLTADVASLIAGDGDIGSAGATGQLDTTISTLIASATNGSVYVGETDGLTLADVSALGVGTNDATVVSAMGDISVQRVNVENRVTLDTNVGAIVDAGPATPFVGIIDDGNVGYTDTGFTVGTNPGFMGDIRFSAANSGNTATWSFTGLAPGVYTVAATWTPNPNRATNAPYTVTDANGTSMFSINQELAPMNDFNESGTPFQQLGGTFIVDGNGTLMVSLTDIGANGFVMADAIRIERIDPRITADELLALAETGIGDGNAIETAVNKFEAETVSGNINIDNQGDLTIGGIGGVNGVSSTGGSVEIGTEGSITVSEDVLAGIDVVLRASDNLTLQNTSTVTTANTINLFGDFGDADSAGATISLLGTLNAAGSSGNITVQGGPNGDTIIVNPGMSRTADGLLLQGLDGDDTYEVHYGRLNGGANAVVIDDAGNGTDQAILAGTSADETFFVDGQTGGSVNNTTEGEQVTYASSLEFLTINGNEGDDTFSGDPVVGDDAPGLEPSFSTTISVNGHAPGFGEPGGDTLILNALDNVFQVVGKTIFVDGNGDDQVVTDNPPLPDAGDYQGINFSGIENLELQPQGPDTILFDFDNTPSSTITQDGYTSVASNQIYGVNGNTFGWNASVGSFDSGPLVGSSEIADDLLRDGHRNPGSNTFTTDIHNGVYRVTVKMGSTGSAYNNLRVSNGDGGQILLDDIDIEAGQFFSQTVVVQVTDGTLDLTIENLGGLPFWVLNGLEIRPGELLTIGTPIPDGDINDPDTDPLVANGAEETMLQIFNVTPGALVTVSGGLDSDLDADQFIDQEIEILSLDAAPEIAGVQIAPVAGEYKFVFRHPFGRGTGYFTFEEVTTDPAGGQTGCTAIEFVAPSVRRFDFGTESSPVQAPNASNADTDGYVGVVGTDVFGVGTGYGWDSAVGSFDRGPVDEAVQGDLRRDGNSNPGLNTFRVELENGEYYVTVTIGDDDSARNNLRILAEGMEQVTDIDTDAGMFKHYTFPVTVSDGILDLTIENLGGLPFWVLNGLEIRPSIATATFDPAGGTPADGTSTETISGTALEAAGLYLTVTTDNGVLLEDASDEYAGHQVLVDNSGEFEIKLQRPLSTMGNVTANLMVQAVDGSVEGQTSVEFTEFVGTPAQRYDFNRGTSPTATDFTPVLITDTFNMTDGYGWVTKPKSFDYNGVSGVTTVDLYRDGVYQSSGATGQRTFRVTAPAATGNEVRVYIGARYAATNVQVTVNGVVGTAMTTSANTYTSLMLDNINAVSGYLDITFEGIGGSWYVSGVDVAADGGLPPAAPLMFAADAGLGAEALSIAELDAIAQTAMARLAAAGEDVSRLADVTLRISDLNNQGALGLAGSRLILIDDDGLGHGWFVDATPWLDEEFAFVSATELVATSASALGRVDLLTVVMHELGHVLGHSDLDPNASAGHLMSGRLDLGTRRLPSADHDGASSVGSSLQAQELSVMPVSPSLGQTTFDSIDPGQPVASQSETVEEEWIGQVAITPEALLSLVSSEKEESSLVETAERDELAVWHSFEEQDALHDLFAELTQSEFASKSLWEQMEN